LEDTPLEDALMLLRAAQELTAIDDVGELLRRAVVLTRRATGAEVVLLGIEDETHPGTFSKILTPDGEASAADAATWESSQPDDEDRDRLLRVPVRVGEQEFATLMVGSWPRPPDRGARLMVEAVAVALGSRLDALRARRVSELHEQVMRTVWELDRTLIQEVDLDVTLPLFADRVRELSTARVVALVGMAETGPRVLASSGSEAGPVLSELAPDIEPVLRDRRAHHWSTLSRTSTHPGATASTTRCTSLVPLDTRDRSPVVLVVHDWLPSSGVNQQQVRDALSTLALHASVILDRERGEREHDLLTVLEDRDRIARDLHDLVIQRLFAVGLTLQGASRRAGNAEVIERLEGAVAELDQTIRDIRATIFELRHRPGAGSFRADLRALIESYGATLGFAPLISLLGPLDSVADDEVHSQVLMVVREALSNVVRHARATSVAVAAEATAESLTIIVQDDGVGIGVGALESGLSNVRARAREREGAVELTAIQPHGTHLRWSIPV
ncbi:MAG: histidine kinase, partial [Ornithinimicrobium sp.]|uniref:sensor histidine kinase n=1 Tax=Ornithinimicrobium sp. TaxID=1977084 RepID=UPI0026DFA8C6